MNPDPAQIADSKTCNGSGVEVETHKDVLTVSFETNSVVDQEGYCDAESPTGISVITHELDFLQVE